ncbi:hybrid sensor histidine kinase/response regulator transcription factor [Sphingobacterium sp. LRF_L2]|uniref:hybrid sensor histidine kinase/response regulator transcription factor n=1 Tax=Sphingobacterium sp. LRF_L2 TaxID=3369421 RepID=UPI003F61C01A
MGAKASTVHCFAQDSLGMLWVGSNNGLYSYDGYALQAPTARIEQYQTFVYAITVLDAQLLALGTGKGLALYNYREDRYLDFPKEGPSDVRSLLLQGNKLWIGSLSGLFCYDTESKKLVDYKGLLDKSFTNQAIYALAQLADKMLVGTYNGLFAFDPVTKTLTALPLPDYRNGSNQFVNSILTLPKTETTFIGTEYGLYVYDNKDGNLRKATVLQNHGIKSIIAKDANTLLIGTDDGLFVYRPLENKLSRIKHDSRNNHTLANNIVWSIYKDRSENIWVGTDLGFSLWAKQLVEKRLPIYQFTNSPDGNRFYKIMKDKADWYWLGGDNGLIRTRRLGAKDFESYWYRMDATAYPLPHNRIRDIYQDREGRLWMASDGGLNLFSPENKQFRSFTIRDSSGKKNAKWAYNILEDKQGNLWLASYMGGIFVLDKEKLIASSGTFVAARNYNRSQGLLADFANQLVEEGNGNVLALFYNKGVSRINIAKNQATELKDETGHVLNQSTFMLKDAEGTVWIGQHGEVRRLGDKGADDLLMFDPVTRGEVTAMVEVGNYIWIATSVGVWRLDKRSLKSELLHYGQDVTSMYYDSERAEVLLGGINEITVLPAAIALPAIKDAQKIVLTAMYVNNEAFGNYEYGLRYRNQIVLQHTQNNLRLEFSDLDYGNLLGYRLAYSFKGKNETWIPLERGDNRVLLSNLASGDYELQLAKVDMSGEVVSPISIYHIVVKYPWYASIFAKTLYGLAALGLIFWVFNFFRVRNILKWERRERHKVLELTRMKMDFLTAISHELKTPLSLILAPISQLILQTKNVEKKKQLEGVHRNALKINNLIQEVMTFDKGEGQDLIAQTLLTSQIDLIPFLKNTLEEWQRMPISSQLHLRFSTAIESCFLRADVSKLSSIVHNLLSNACKYNRDQGTVELCVEQMEHAIVFQVTDTGQGISAEDLTYVFSKFYRSSAKEITAVEGTGVGLYLVKNYCEQMGWEIALQSIYGQGTTVRITIPQAAVQSESFLLNTVDNRERLLIVEDNEELSSFLQVALDGIYTVLAVRNGKEALQLVSNHNFMPGIIISDAMMPIMGGVEMAKKLRQNAATATIPILLLTAKNDEQIQRDWVSAGIDAFMAKPFDLDLLKLQLEQLLAKKDKLVAQLRLDEISKPVLGNEKESPDEKFLTAATLVIENNIDDSDFSVQRLSEEVDLAPKQLYRKIKQLTGYTPVEYIRTIRIKKAALLLQQKKFTVAEVMYMVGFSNASYFSKCFQAEFGMTPKAYVDKNK